MTSMNLMNIIIVALMFKCNDNDGYGDGVGGGGRGPFGLKAASAEGPPTGGPSLFTVPWHAGT